MMAEAISGNWMALLFGAACIALFAAGILSRSKRAWPLYGWLSSGCAGFVFLSFHFEYAAITVWTGSVGLCAVFLTQSLNHPHRPGLRNITMTLLSTLYALALGLLLVRALTPYSGTKQEQVEPSVEALGSQMIRDHSASFLVLGLGLLTVALGLGRVLRSSQPGEREES